MTPRNAFLFGLALSAAGFIELGLGVNWLGCLGLFTLVTYLVYTPQTSHRRRQPLARSPELRPRSSASPPPAALTAEAWVLYAIFSSGSSPTSTPRVDAGKTTSGLALDAPVVEPDGESTVRQMLLFSVLLIPVSLAPATSI
jgi:protoheme IX farnesyltransferase